MEYAKLEALLVQLYKTRNFFDGLAPKESLSKFVRLSDYTSEIFSMFNEVPSELDKNLNLCTTPFQKDNIIEHYYSRLSPAHNFFAFAWDCALSRGKIDSTGYREQNYISDEQVKELLEGINQMGRWIEVIKPKEQTSKEETKNTPLVKIKWDGQKNQLYDVIRQLKDREGKILNGYPELAVFLKTNFEIFENTTLSTITTELQRDKRPTKGKRINLDTENQPE